MKKLNAIAGFVLIGTLGYMAYAAYTKKETTPGERAAVGGGFLLAAGIIVFNSFKTVKA